MYDYCITGLALSRHRSNPDIILQTIVATALPTIVAKLGGGKEYSWVGRYVFVILPLSSIMTRLMITLC